MNVKLLHNARAMGFSGFDADIENAGYFLSCFSLSDELQDLAFAGAQGLRGELCLILVRLNHGARYFRAEIDTAARSFAYGLNEVFGGVSLHDITLCTNAKSVEQVGIFVVDGKKDGFRLRGDFLNLLGRINAIEDGHAHVEHGDI